MTCLYRPQDQAALHGIVQGNKSIIEAAHLAGYSKADEITTRLRPHKHPYESSDDDSNSSSSSTMFSRRSRSRGPAPRLSPTDSSCIQFIDHPSDSVARLVENRTAELKTLPEQACGVVGFPIHFMTCS